MGTVLTRMNQEERNTTRKETRRHTSFEAYDLSGDHFKATDGNPEDIVCHKEEIYALYRAINTLNENQKRLIPLAPLLTQKIFPHSYKISYANYTRTVGFCSC